MSKLVVTVGLPKSGKTTYCNKLLKPQGFVVVNPDSFRLAIHGFRFLKSAESFVWATVYAAVDALRLAGHSVVVDATHMTAKRREPWVERGAEFVLMKTTKEECLRRAEALNDLEIMPVIERMAAECDWREAIGLPAKPTIEELEKILDQPEDGRAVEINPDGSVRVKNASSSS